MNKFVEGETKLNLPRIKSWHTNILYSVHYNVRTVLKRRMRNGLDCSFKFGVPVPDYDFSTKNKEQEMPKTSQGL
jgi:hypothetical protein